MAATWTDIDEAVVGISENPNLIATVLEAELDQATLNRVENAIMPVANEKHQLITLQRSLDEYTRQGVTTASVIDPLVAEIARLEGR